MKIGKFTITQDILDKKSLAALTQFITTNIVILEKIVILDPKTKKQAIVMIGICDTFADCNDTTRLIPEYVFNFQGSLLAVEDGELVCSVSPK